VIEAIDVHTHIFAPGWPDFASRFGGDRWPRLEGDSTTGCERGRRVSVHPAAASSPPRAGG
jgi:hypothetical protein